MSNTLLMDRISINPKICHGRPYIKGTRIMVQQVLDLLAEGLSLEQIISADYFPDLKKEDILAGIAFANRLLKDEEICVYEEESINT